MSKVPPRLPAPPSSQTPNCRTYPAYEHWLRTEAGIYCPKVQVIGFHGDVGVGRGGLGGTEPVGPPSPTERGGARGKKKKSRQHRGLYATERIEPGERILRIPARTLIGEEMLRARGGGMLEEKEEEAATAASAAEPDSGREPDSPPVRRRKMEDGLIALIEEIRRLSYERRGVASPSSSSPTQQRQHQRHGTLQGWDADHGVALFLVGCRKIQMEVPYPGTAEEEGSDDAGEPCLGVEEGGGEGGGDGAPPPPSFVPHVSMLPHSFPTNRLYYTPEELERMGGEIRTDGGKVTRTDMLRQIEADWQMLVQLLTEYYDAKGGIDRVRCEMCQGGGGSGDGGQSREPSPCSCFVLDPKVDLTIDAYKWALSNIYSRSTDFQWKDESGSFSGDDEGGEAARGGSDGDGSSEAAGNDGDDRNRIRLRRVIAPMVDMMNHDFASQVRHTMDREGNISLYNGSDKPIEPQTEILLNYGIFPNEKLLLVYGFFFFFSNE